MIQLIKANKLIVGLGVALAVIALLTGVYMKGRGDGKAVARAEYAEQALEVAQQARIASEQASADKDERDSEYALEQGEIADVVEKEYEAGGDPTAALLGELRKAKLDRDKAARR